MSRMSEAHALLDNDLPKIIPVPVFVTVGGKKIEVKTMRVKQLTKVMAEIQPFIGSFTTTDGANLPLILLNHTDNVIGLVSTLTGEPIDWLGELGLDEMVLLFTAVVEVNLDFFIQKVLPAVTTAMQRLAGPERLMSLGPKPSNT